MLRSCLVIAWILLASVNASCGIEAGSAAYGDVRFDTISTLGTLDGDTAQVIGRISSVDVNESGEVLVLDGQTPAVLVYDSTGSFVDALRAQGLGPGHLAGPTAARWAPDGTVRVMDARNGRLEVFSVGSGGFAPLHSLQPDVLGRGLCQIENRWYTDRLLDRASFHELDASGTHIRSFGPPLDVSTYIRGPVGPLIVETFAAGPFTCAEEAEALIALPTALPIVRAFDASGDLHWEVTLEDYVPLRVESAGRGVRSEPAQGTGSHVALGVVPWDDDVVLVQLEIRKQDPVPEDGDYHVVQSRFLAYRDGVELGRTEALPRIGAIWKDRLYAIRTNPFPHVIVLRRR